MSLASRAAIADSFVFAAATIMLPFFDTLLPLSPPMADADDIQPP